MEWVENKIYYRISNVRSADVKLTNPLCFPPTGQRHPPRARMSQPGPEGGLPRGWPARGWPPHRAGRAQAEGPAPRRVPVGRGEALSGGSTGHSTLSSPLSADGVACAHGL